MITRRKGSQREYESRELGEVVVVVVRGAGEWRKGERR